MIPTDSEVITTSAAIPLIPLFVATIVIVVTLQFCL